MMKLNQLLKPNVVDTETFSQLPPKHKEVVNDFFSQVDYDSVDVVKEVESTVDKVALKHNVQTNRSLIVHIDQYHSLHHFQHLY